MIREEFEPLLARLGDRVSERRMRLFACAYVRQVWDWLSDARSCRAIEVAERFADSAAEEAELVAAHEAAGKAAQQADRAAALSAAPLAWRMTPIHAALGLAGLLHTGGEVELLRCIFGDLLHHSAPCHDVQPSIGAGDHVAELARCAYEHRQQPSGTLDPSRLAALADGLQEIGCTDADLLEHLRGPGPHVRGCWALETILKWL